MYLAGKVSSFQVKDWKGREPHHLRWWDQFLEDVEISHLEGKCRAMSFITSKRINQTICYLFQE